MDIIALPVSSLPSDAASATPGFTPPIGTDGFAHSLDQAASRQIQGARDAAFTPERQVARAATAEMPTTLAGAAQPLATLRLPGLSLAHPAGDLNDQSDQEENATLSLLDDSSEATLTYLAGMLLPGPPAAAFVTPATSESGAFDDLQRIRARLQVIESAGQLPFPDAAGAALTSVTVTMDAPATVAGQPALPTISPPPAASSTTTGFLANTGWTELAPLTDSKQIETAASNLRAGTRQLEFAGSEQVSHAVPLSEGRLPSGIESLSGNGVPLPPTADRLSLSVGSTAANLTAPLASSDWQRGLGRHLLGLQQRGEQEIELHLHPAELGPLSISLKLGESTAQAQFLSAHPQVRAAVEQAIPQLREALAEQGIVLGEASVGERQQQPRGEQETPRDRSGGWPPDNAEEVSGPEAGAPSVARASENIDIYA